MPHHYTKATVAASSWCNRCNKQTMHRIDAGRLGPCKDCMKALGEQHEEHKTEVKIEQKGFNFGN